MPRLHAANMRFEHTLTCSVLKRRREASLTQTHLSGTESELSRYAKLISGKFGQFTSFVLVKNHWPEPKYLARSRTLWAVASLSGQDKTSCRFDEPPI